MAVEFEHSGNSCRVGKYKVSDDLFLDLVFNNNCNCACPFCIANTKEFAEEDFDKWKVNLYRTFNLFNIKDVIILGGEATIDKRFFEKLDILKDVIKNSNVDNVILTTNGIMLRNENFLKRLTESCVSAVNISIMNHDKTKNDKIYRANTLTRDEVGGGIFKILKNAGMGLRINCNVYKGNCDSVEEMKGFVEHFKGCADAIKFSPLMETDMFDTCNKVTEYSHRVCLKKEEIFKLYDEFASRHQITQENANVFGLVPYKKLQVLNQTVILKYQQVEDQYDLDSEIPTLKLYPNGNLANEWNFKKNILDETLEGGNYMLQEFIEKEREFFPDWLKCFNFNDENLKLITDCGIFPIKEYNSQKILGFYTLNEKGEFKNLYISKENRNRGIATRALEFEKMNNPLLTVAVAKENSSIKQLVEKLGFQSTKIEVKGKFDISLIIYKWEK